MVRLIIRCMQSQRIARILGIQNTIELLNTLKVLIQIFSAQVMRIIKDCKAGCRIDCPRLSPRYVRKHNTDWNTKYGAT